MKNYVIFTPSLKENSGGVLVLHTLGRRLQEKGCKVYMFCEHTFDDLNVITQSEFDKINDECIVIYPEIYGGNPLKAKNVVRWILFHCGRKWDKNDMVYLLWDFFSINNSVRVDGYLRVIDFKLDFFKNFEKERTINSYMVRKGKRIHNEFNKHSEDSVCTDGNIDHETLRDIYNKTNNFVCYDDATYHSVIAALCGADSIVIPNGKDDKDTWIRQLPIFKYGIAYGLDDIDWAKKTKHKLRDYLSSLEIEYDKLLMDFIKNTQLRFGD